MERISTGALGGFVATIPMTAAMMVLHKALPRSEQKPLPPRQITMNTAEALGVREYLTEDAKTLSSYVAHFSYGTAVGALSSNLLPRSRHPVVAGMGFGLAVWAGSYLGWLPVTGLFPPPNKETKKRHALMIAAHLVWGGTLGVVAARRGRLAGFNRR